MQGSCDSRSGPQVGQQAAGLQASLPEAGLYHFEAYRAARSLFPITHTVSHDTSSHASHSKEA